MTTRHLFVSSLSAVGAALVASLAASLTGNPTLATIALLAWLASSALSAVTVLVIARRSPSRRERDDGILLAIYAAFGLCYLTAPPGAAFIVGLALLGWFAYSRLSLRADRLAPA